MSSYLVGIILGVVQGISEWLPISSKTQIIIASTFLLPSLSFARAYALGLFLEAGTFVAAVVYFRREVKRVLLALIGKGDEEGRLLLKFLIIVTAVTAVLGVVIYEGVSEAITGPVLDIPMIVLGCVLIGDGLLIQLSRGRYLPTKGLRDITFLEMVLIGVAQGLAVFPGVSRSGVTVSAMLLMRIRPEESFRLSFIALIPASVGASALTLIATRAAIGGAIDTITLPVLLVAIVVTAVIGLASIRMLLRAAGGRRIVLLAFGLGMLAILSGVASYFSGIG